MNILRSYKMQRNMAKKRGIDWQFTYETWLDWWGDDITRRGRKKDSLVMARYGDTGPYSPENCKKITHSENSKERNLINPVKSRHKVMTEFGIYDNAKSFAESHNIDVSTYYRRCQKNPTIYYTIKG